MITSKRITSITIKQRRPASPEKISQLCESIQAVGLLNPITVTDWGVLVAGLHRLEACKKLGWLEIPCTVIKEEDAEIAEIDENLIRNELTALERGELLARRKVLYEEMHPETKAGNTVERQEVKRNDFVLPPSFAEDTASKTGMTPRSVQQDIQIAKAITPEVKEIIRSTPLADKKTDLLHLARMEPSEQQTAVAKVSSGEVKTISQYIKEQSKQDPDCKKIDREHKIQDTIGDCIDLVAIRKIKDYDEAVSLYFEWNNVFTVEDCLHRLNQSIEHLNNIKAALKNYNKLKVVK